MVLGLILKILERITYYRALRLGAEIRIALAGFVCKIDPHALIWRLGFMFWYEGVKN